MTEWDEFKKLNPNDDQAHMRQPWSNLEGLYQPEELGQLNYKALVLGPVS